MKPTRVGPFNLGVGPNDFRVPDAGYHGRLISAVWVPTAAIVVEIVSPDDETYDKFDFFWRHDVTEILVADPAQRSVRCRRRGADCFEPATRSGLLDVAMDDISREITWP